MKIALLVPHFFMQQIYLDKVIFSPGSILIDLAKELAKQGNQVTVYSCGKLKLGKNIESFYPKINLLQNELKQRGYDIHQFMQKHPLTYITAARQFQSEIISACYENANLGLHDIVHVWINEEDIALQFARFLKVPSVFTHHEPFNYLAKYRISFEKYSKLNWISISYSQRKTVMSKLNWVGNVYHGVNPPNVKSVRKEKYVAFLGRIIEPKGVELAIRAVKIFNKENKKDDLLVLKIAGKHYSGKSKNDYWEKFIKPQIDNKEIQYVGFLGDSKEKFTFLKNAYCLIAPSIWEEPFGMMLIESLSVGTPIVGFKKGSLPEIINSSKFGFLANIEYNQDGSINKAKSSANLSKLITKIGLIDRNNLEKIALSKFSVKKMAKGYIEIYKKLVNKRL